MKENGKLIFAIHAFDIGPSKNLQKLEIVALMSGHGVKSIYNCSLGRTNLISDDTDVLITGLSSFHPDEELEIGKQAYEMNIPWYIISDTHGNWGRPSAKGKIDNAIAIVASPEEIQGALDFGYKDAFYLGGPPEWSDFWNIKAADIDLGDKFTVLIGGIKSAAITNTLVKETISAMNKVFNKWQMIFKPHPNENIDTDESREDILRKVHVIESDARLMNLLPVVNLTVLTSGTTAIIQAARLRVPCIYYEDDAVKKRMEFQSGTSKWFPVESGVCAKASPENFPEKIRSLVSEEGISALQARQEIIYPTMNEDQSSEKMILNHITKEI